MNRFVLDTRKSLYAPIEVEIDRKIYQTIKITRAVKSELFQIEKEIPIELKDGDNNSMRKWICFMFDIDNEILEKLDVREVEDIYIFTNAKLRDMEAERMKREFGIMEKQIKRLGIKKPELEPEPKNVKRPGRKKSS